MNFTNETVTRVALGEPSRNTVERVLPIRGTSVHHRGTVNGLEPGRKKQLRLLGLLLSNLYRNFISSEHLADLRKSGLTDETIQAHSVRSVPPWMITGLLGFDPSYVQSALLFPFLAAGGGFINHIRVKVFGTQAACKDRPKYLQPKGAPPRIYFTVPALQKLENQEPLWCVEGEKKALAVAQLGLPAIGFSGIHGWHSQRHRDLLPDFDFIQLQDRIVELVPDGDWKTNPHVERGANGLAFALRARGARVRLVDLSSELKTNGKDRD